MLGGSGGCCSLKCGGVVDGLRCGGHIASGFIFLKFVAVCGVSCYTNQIASSLASILIKDFSMFL